MSYLSVNGLELNVPLNPEASFQELIHYLRKSLTSESVLISSVKVDGAEVSEPEEVKLAQTPISQLKRVEVLTRHPKELAQETLHDALEFVLVLEGFCIKAAESAGKSSGNDGQEATGKEDFFSYLGRLVDGISYLSEAIIHVKKILKIGVFQVTDVLEADLISILKDLLQFQQKGEWDHLVELMQQHLLANLEEWRTKGIPALIRSRDS